ncbi:MAG: YggT family protein [Caldilineaceae bacterium]|nr:YggT family protein [Caldilineaceae bacterium]
MTVQRREEYTEVVNYDTANAGPVVVNTHSVETNDLEPYNPTAAGVYNPTPTIAYETETITHDPHAARLMQVVKIQQVIFLLFGIVEALLGIRFVLGLLGANPAAGFAQMIYGITDPFLAPFVGLFGQPTFEGMVFDWNALVAILVYALLAGLLAKLVAFTMDTTRRDTYTSTTSRINRV